MNRNTRLIFMVCVAAVAGVVLLQFFWIRNYYQVNRERFEKEINLTFEDAVREEFKVRCDTLEGRLVKFLMDTSEISITSKWNEKEQNYVYSVANVKNKKDAHSFSHKFCNLPILPGNDSVKRIVARIYAQTYRKEDLENHFIWYHTQNLGKYISNAAAIFNFDTTRLRTIYIRMLAAQEIREPFVFYMRDRDSAFNHVSFPDTLQRIYPVISRSYPTYEVTPGKNYIRALFRNPRNYLYGKMTGIVLASALLLSIVAFALYYLLQIIRREKRLSVIKNDFISNISHELKTPVATVAAAVEALKGFGALEDPVRAARYLDISKNELDRLSEMVNKILHLSLYEKQDIELKMEWIDLDTTIRAISDNYSLSTTKKIILTYDREPGMNTLLADRLHLQSTLNNLIDNAVKYSGEEVSIMIRLYREKEFVVISVKDDGIGIARADLPFIFDKFYRVSSGNIHRVKGYGLGLTYVSLIMQQLGGWCTVESSLGKGSIFKLGFRTGAAS